MAPTNPVFLAVQSHLEVACVHSLASHVQQPDVGGRLGWPQHVFLRGYELYGCLAHLRPPRWVAVSPTHLWGGRGSVTGTFLFISLE